MTPELLRTLVTVALVAAGVPALLVARNLFAYRRAAPAPRSAPAATSMRSPASAPVAAGAGGTRAGSPAAASGAVPADATPGALHVPGRAANDDAASISVLVPARDEEASIGELLASVLANRGVDFELVVLDDDSSDATARIVQEAASADARVRLERAPPLPPGWCGKQHACATLATLARHPLLLFLDADVRLEPNALVRLAGEMHRRDVGLLSGFPRQITGTWLERLLIPLIHYVLLGFLPIDAMRRTGLAGFGAGCGQLMLARRDDYLRAGGHGAIRESLHDGVRLPRAFRAAGARTDLVDATDLARCRMYRNAAEVWSGLSKNATEGLAAPVTIAPMSAWLLAAGVLPAIVALASLAPDVPPALRALAFGSLALALLPRLAMARRFDQSVASAVLHPVGVTLLLVIQWQAALGRLAGRSSSWKGRSYPHVPRSGTG